MAIFGYLICISALNPVRTRSSHSHSHRNTKAYSQGKFQLQAPRATDHGMRGPASASSPSSAGCPRYGQPYILTKNEDEE